MYRDYYLTRVSMIYTYLAVCPSEEALLAFAEGSMPEARREAMLAHIGTCDDCRQTLSAIVARPFWEIDDPNVKRSERGEVSKFTSDTSGAARSDRSDDRISVSAIQSIGTRAHIDRAQNTGAPPSLSSEPVAGTLLDSRYLLGERIGKGGMGVVYRAEHTRLNCAVAIKFLGRLAVTAPNARARFFREAQMVARLRSDHVVRVMDVSTSEVYGDYVVMELLDGEDMAHALRRLGPMEPSDVAAIALQACAALADAHAAGIVHRDIKPANLFLLRHAEQPTVKVLDFGLSKSGSGDVNDVSLTDSATIVGSPLYMSPEQASRPREVDFRADIWSLGCVMYEGLTGTPPFRGDTTLDVVAQIVGAGRVVPLRTLRSGISRDFEALIMRCLERDPAQRYASVAELAVALAPHAGGRAAVWLADVQRRLPTTQSKSKRTTRMGLAVTIAMMILLGTTGWYWAQRQSRSEGGLEQPRLPLTWPTVEGTMNPWQEPVVLTLPDAARFDANLMHDGPDATRQPTSDGPKDGPGDARSPDARGVGPLDERR